MGWLDTESKIQRLEDAFEMELAEEHRREQEEEAKREKTSKREPWLNYECLDNAEVSFLVECSDRAKEHNPRLRAPGTPYDQIYNSPVITDEDRQRIDVIIRKAYDGAVRFDAAKDRISAYFGCPKFRTWFTLEAAEALAKQIEAGGAIDPMVIARVISKC
jgi:hypothetical protein